mmetsp:Transcript_1927/g.5848  ORF Transcript_1927/g.5848 Transcript_1927/m.5848 type:complete len:423 (-) Transcript_1927:95-1363(-)
MMWQGVVGLFAAALAALSPQEERQAIGAVRRPMCEAIVDEMHIEIAKHTLRKDGEDDVWETVPAICLAIVQNYTLVRTAPPSRGWLLDKRAVRLDDLEPGDTSPADFEHLLLLKKACEHYTEEWQHELSGAMYTRTAAGLSANKIASDLCDDVAPPVRPKRKARANGGSGGGSGGGGAKKGSGKGGKKGGKKGSSPGGEGEGVPSMDELLQKYDTDGTITRLMELERESPEAMLEPAQLEEATAGAEHLRCGVCRAMCKQALVEARAAKALRDEESLSAITASLCVGVPTGYDDPENQPKYPGNPPLWGERYRVRKRRGAAGKERWRLEPLPKKAAPEEQSGAEYDSLVMKHAMITRACRAVESDVDGDDLAETIYSLAASLAASQPGKKLGAAALGDAFCARHCEAESGGEGAPTKDRDEL